MTYTMHSTRLPIRAKLIVPGSRNMTARALLLAALAEGVSEITEIALSNEIHVFLDALHELGVPLQFDKKARSCVISGGNGKFPNKEASIWCDDTAAVARFILAACAVSGGSYHFDASTLFSKKRSMRELLQVLRNQEVLFTPENAERMPFLIKGTDGLRGGLVEIDTSKTDQLASALLMVAPFSKMPLEMQIDDLITHSYIEMTYKMMADFGVLVKRIPGGRYVVPVPQRYHARNYVVEPDFIIASYFFAAAAITGGEITIQAFDRKNLRQHDAEFLSVLEKMGCTVLATSKGLTVKGGAELSGVSVDMRHYSDTFTSLAVIAPFATTPTSITNIGQARKKDSDLIAVMRSALEKLEIKVEEGPDWLKIYPSHPRPGFIECNDDYRIAMAFTVLGLRIPGIELDDVTSISEACPAFFDMWEKLV